MRVDVRVREFALPCALPVRLICLPHRLFQEHDPLLVIPARSVCRQGRSTFYRARPPPKKNTHTHGVCPVSKPTMYVLMDATAMNEPRTLDKT